MIVDGLAWRELVFIRRNANGRRPVYHTREDCHFGGPTRFKPVKLGFALAGLMRACMKCPSQSQPRARSRCHEPANGWGAFEHFRGCSCKVDG